MPVEIGGERQLAAGFENTVTLLKNKRWIFEVVDAQIGNDQVCCLIVKRNMFCRTGDNFDIGQSVIFYFFTCQRVGIFPGIEPSSNSKALASTALICRSSKTFLCCW